MRTFRLRTLKHRLILVNVATTGAALIVALALMLSTELRTGKEMLVRDIAIKADILGSQCSAALVFNDPGEAERILGALREDPQIDYAAVYTGSDALFASFSGRDVADGLPKAPPAEGHSFGAEYLDLSRPIVLHKDTIGTITIRASLKQFRVVLLRYAFASAVILVVSLLAATLLMTRLQRIVTGPVTMLVRLMERVSQDKDYTRRAEVSGPEELVSLAGRFNEMLTAIQNRDRDLECSLKELKDACRKLEDLDRQKSDFITTVSHELRTPITSIKAFVELLLMKRDMEGDRKDKLLATINEESDRLTRLISTLLDLSRIESGTMHWRSQHVDLAETVRTTINGILPLAQRKDVAIEQSVESGLPLIRVDGDRMVQVIMNLLSNAVKFTPPGGKISISVGQAGEPPGLAVSIADTGAGIAPQDLGMIFEKFHRSGEALTSGIEGTGLGLTISREIVNYYGGRIWAASELGKGSVFTFTIPFERPIINTLGN
jgi:signal transduction histidine kinase